MVQIAASACVERSKINVIAAGLVEIKLNPLCVLKVEFFRWRANSVWGVTTQIPSSVGSTHISTLEERRVL